MSRAVTSKSSPPDRRKLIGIITVAVIVIGAIVVVGLYSRPNNVIPQSATKAVGSANLKVGQVAPEFTAQTNAGPFDLSSVQTPVLLEVFATWCPHCQRETVILNDLATKYQGKIAIVAVSGSAQDMTGSGPESQADVNTFGATFNVRYPIAFDPDLKVASLYLKTGFPTMVLIGANKKIAWSGDGEVKEATLDKAIRQVTAATPST
ncbi:MAG TPA: TlpA disulfide reductase family protein [Candidatus Elarobacter sp.]|jgi:thiol-disulfide isomerase/thioredoxin|nr:TlpA disulfide reductase family protein [Candidatus Elarobacter sp.]